MLILNTQVPCTHGLHWDLGLEVYITVDLHAWSYGLSSRLDYMLI